jgi:hypothetical protein
MSGDSYINELFSELEGRNTFRFRLADVVAIGLIVVFVVLMVCIQWPIPQPLPAKMADIGADSPRGSGETKSSQNTAEKKGDVPLYVHQIELSVDL